MKPQLDTLLNSWQAPEPDTHFEARVIQHAYQTQAVQNSHSPWLRRTAAALLLFVGGSLLGTVITTPEQSDTVALYSIDEDSLWTL